MIKARFTLWRVDRDIATSDIHRHPRVVARLIAEMQPQGRPVITFVRDTRGPDAHAHVARVRQSITQVDDEFLIGRYNHNIR